MSRISLCRRDEPEAPCFGYTFGTHDACDAVRMDLRHPSRFICKAGDRVVGDDAAPQPSPTADALPFATRSGFAQYDFAHDVPRCSAPGDTCDPLSANLQCCAGAPCRAGRCVSVLPKTMQALQSRASIAGVSLRGHGEAILREFQNARTPTGGMHAAAASTPIGVGEISKLRADDVRCFPEATVGQAAWDDGPHRCYSVSGASDRILK